MERIMILEIMSAVLCVLMAVFAIIEHNPDAALGWGFAALAFFITFLYEKERRDR